MRNKLIKSAANIITSSRIVLSLVLLLLKVPSIPFYIIYSVCGLTDMLDGFVARKTHSQSEFGAKLDSISDLVFVAVCLIKLLPVLEFKTWIWIWIALIFAVKIFNVILGYAVEKKLVMLHAVANKITGLLLFLLPLFIGTEIINIAAILVCAVATFAAVQEGYLIKIGRKNEKG
ncbi:MAG: CDP-alcohol phosphatidyltransferase family protein [Acutalibacteraceae bacterium]